MMRPKPDCVAKVVKSLHKMKQKKTGKTTENNS